MLRFFTLVIIVVGLAVVVGVQEKSVRGAAVDTNETFIERATRTRSGQFQVERSIDSRGFAD